MPDLSTRKNPQRCSALCFEPKDKLSHSENANMLRFTIQCSLSELSILVSSELYFFTQYIGKNHGITSKPNSKERHAVAVETYPSGVLTMLLAWNTHHLVVVAGAQQASCAVCYTVITSAGAEEACSHLLITKSYGTQIPFWNPVCVKNV